MMAARPLGPQVWFGFLAALAAVVVIGTMGGRGGFRSTPSPGPAAPGPAEAAPRWLVPLRGLDEALARGDISAAQMAWHQANGEALRTRDWRPMVAVGEAALKIGEAAGSRKAVEPRARQAYLSALFRARRQGSLDGVFQATEGFARLGDEEVVRQCLHVAEIVAATGGDPRARERLLAFREQLAARSFDPGIRPGTLF